MTDGMPGPASHTYFSQRLRLHYVDWANPDRPPLLMLHGGLSLEPFWSCRADWTRDGIHGQRAPSQEPRGALVLIPVYAPVM